MTLNGQLTESQPYSQTAGVALGILQACKFIKNAFPVSSGGLHPGLVPPVLDLYGTDLVLLVSGGIHGHPRGTRAGAEATMQAIEAWCEGVTLAEKAKKAKELAGALDKWGSYKPK